MTKVRTAIGTAAALATAAVLVTSAPPAGAANSYVALGDSYSSGTGTRTYINDGSSCMRSTLAYPSLIAASAGLTLNFRACSGATVADVTKTQLGALSRSTTQVTLSIGGNDAGFADVLTECALPAWASDCNAAIDTARSIVTTTLPGRLSTLYAAIRTAAPSAKVVVVGYPRIFQGEDCNALTWFSPQEEARLNAMADLLDSTTAARASAKGFAFANPTTAFTGHAVCDDSEWLNGLSNPIQESYHPNAAGHRGYTAVVGPPLVGHPVSGASAAVVRRATASGNRLAAQQRRYAAVDAAITPREVNAPDLRSARVRAAAARAGVDLGNRASIDAADRRYAAVQSLEAVRATQAQRLSPSPNR